MLLLPNSAFRDAMRRVASTVNIVTIRTADGDPMGMTATAVSSLSADPPSLLVCVNQSSSMHDHLALAPRFCINVLRGDQTEIAKRFSDRTMRDVRFADGGWERDSDGLPYLPDAQANLLCTRTQTIAVATHSICIGTVDLVGLNATIDPLVYVDGRYGAVTTPDVFQF